MKMTECRRVLVQAALIFLTSGCIHFAPRSVSPSGMLDAFESRALDRADLHAYLCTNGLAASWPLEHWSLPSLTLAAFFYHPDLDVARAQLDIARGEAGSAAERPNPSLSVAPGYNTTHTPSPLSYWIADIVLSIPIETAGKRGYRIAQAQKLTEATRLNIAQAAWQVRQRVRTGLFDLYAAQENEKQAQKLHALQAEAASLLAKQAEAGETTHAEAAKARTQEDSSRLALLGAQQKAAAARIKLATAIGVPASSFNRIAIDFTEMARTPTNLPSAKLRRSALLSRTDLLSALATYEASQSALQLEVAKQYPDFELGPAYQYDQGENKWSLGLTVALPVLNRNRGAIAAADARRAEAAANVQALQARIIGAIEQAAEAYRAALEREDAALHLAESLEQGERASQALRAAGVTSRLDALAEQIERAILGQSCLESRLDACAAWGGIEDALQLPSDLSDWAQRIPQARAENAKETDHE